MVTPEWPPLRVSNVEIDVESISTSMSMQMWELGGRGRSGSYCRFRGITKRDRRERGSGNGKCQDMGEKSVTIPE